MCRLDLALPAPEHDAARNRISRPGRRCGQQPFIAHLERVEIIKGPGSAMFGDANPGGTVNLVTKEPLAETRREVELRLGSYSEAYAAIALTGAAVEDSESFRNQYFQKGWLLAPSITWRPTPTTRLNLDIVHVDDRSVLDRGQPNIGGAGELGLVPIEVMVTQPGDRLDGTDTSVALSVEQAIGDDWIVSGALMRYRYREKLQKHGLNYYATPSVIDLYATDRDSRADTTNATVRAMGHLATDRVQHELVVGADTARPEDFQDDAYTPSDTVGMLPSDRRAATDMPPDMPTISVACGLRLKIWCNHRPPNAVGAPSAAHVSAASGGT